jgi:hypothetical protein
VLVSNHKGGTVILTSSLVALDTESDNQGAYELTLRSQIGNAGTMWFGKDADNVTGFLEPGDSHTFVHIQAKHVYVMGTAGDVVFWTGSGH